MLETPASEKEKKGEYLLSGACVQKNLDTGTFVDVSDRVKGAGGKVYVLATDLN